MTATGKKPLCTGDRVRYLTTDGVILGNATGRVLGLMRTREKNILADVEWDRLGMPQRVTLDRLIKIMDSDR
jgi:hypothetical protein